MCTLAKLLGSNDFRSKTLLLPHFSSIISLVSVWSFVACLFAMSSSMGFGFSSLMIILIFLLVLLYWLVVFLIVVLRIFRRLA